MLGSVRLPHYHACLATIYAAGLRLGEGVQLRVAQIDSARMVIHIQGGKGAKDRYVPLSPPLLTLLRTHWASHRHPMWLFPARWHKARAAEALAPRSVERAFQAAVSEVGITKH